MREVATNIAAVNNPIPSGQRPQRRSSSRLPSLLLALTSSSRHCVRRWGSSAHPDLQVGPDLLSSQSLSNKPSWAMWVCMRLQHCEHNWALVEEEVWRAFGFVIETAKSQCTGASRKQFFSFSLSRFLFFFYFVASSDRKRTRPENSEREAEDDIESRPWGHRPFARARRISQRARWRFFG